VSTLLIFILHVILSSILSARLVHLCLISPIKLRYKGKVVPVLNKAPRHKNVSGEWRYSSTHS
jgi:hypothetical protein